MYIIITVVCVCGGQDDERERMMGDVTNKKKTIEISAPDFFAHTILASNQ